MRPPGPFTNVFGWPGTLRLMGNKRAKADGQKNMFVVLLNVFFCFCSFLIMTIHLSHSNHLFSDNFVFLGSINWVNESKFFLFLKKKVYF